jgi:phage terminase small subunit
MTKEGKKEYRKFVKIYRDLDTNILSDLDVPTLAQYCEALVIYQEALETYNLYHHEDDLKTMERQSKLMSSLSGDLCITPVARARMGILTVKRESQRHEDRKGALAAMKETD